MNDIRVYIPGKRLEDADHHRTFCIFIGMVHGTQSHPILAAGHGC